MRRHAVYTKPLAAESQGFPNGGVDGNVVLFGHVAAHVVFRYLGGVHRDDFGARAGRLTILAVAFQIFADDYVGMRVVPVFGHHGSNAFRGSCPSLREQGDGRGSENVLRVVMCRDRYFVACT